MNFVSAGCRWNSDSWHTQKFRHEPDPSCAQCEAPLTLVKFLLQLSHGFQYHIPDNRHIERTDFIESVLRGMPVALRRVVVQINDINRRDAARKKRIVVIT